MRRAVSTQLSPDGAGVSFEQSGDLSLRVPTHSQRRNAVSFFAEHRTDMLLEAGAKPSQKTFFYPCSRDEIERLRLRFRKWAQHEGCRAAKGTDRWLRVCKAPDGNSSQVLREWLFFVVGAPGQPAEKIVQGLLGMRRRADLEAGLVCGSRNASEVQIGNHIYVPTHRADPPRTHHCDGRLVSGQRSLSCSTEPLNTSTSMSVVVPGIGNCARISLENCQSV